MDHHQEDDYVDDNDKSSLVVRFNCPEEQIRKGLFPEGIEGGLLPRPLGCK